MSIKQTLTAAGILFAAIIASTPAPAAQPVLTGEICDTRVHQLTSQIHWYSNLHQAEDEARKENKLVFWMHMLGHIDGAT